MKIRKHSGELAQFDQEKLRQSMLRSGAAPELVDDICAAVRSQLYPGMTTRQIYKTAFKMLKGKSAASAARYNLRDAIRLLGPAGFHFEKYVGRIFADHGYRTLTNLHLTGRCVSHEVDLAIEKDGELKFVECKFHSRREIASDVKVPMYILSRFNDLREVGHGIFTPGDSFSSCAIVTNNRFTSDAILFAECMGLELLSWDFPAGKSLRSLNDGRNLYPVTAMTTLTIAEKQWLLDQDIVLARELNSRELLEKLGLSSFRIKNVMTEASALKHGTK